MAARNKALEDLVQVRGGQILNLTDPPAVLPFVAVAIRHLKPVPLLRATAVSPCHRWLLLPAAHHPPTHPLMATAGGDHAAAVGRRGRNQAHRPERAW